MTAMIAVHCEYKIRIAENILLKLASFMRANLNTEMIGNIKYFTRNAFPMERSQAGTFD